MDARRPKASRLGDEELHIDGRSALCEPPVGRTLQLRHKRLDQSPTTPFRRVGCRTTIISDETIASEGPLF